MHVSPFSGSGKWYVVRFWEDIPGQEKRIHASKRVCPTAGPGSLTKAQRKTKALEIVMSSGVNDAPQFVETTIGVTFKEQSKLFMRQETTSKRKPVKPATLRTWQNCLCKWLNPSIGDIPLASINNAVMKHLVTKMAAAGLSAKTIVNYTGLVKLVVASAKSDEGEPLFPRKWDSEFIDLPIVRNQHKFTAATMSSIVQNATGQYRVLYALLAGSGLRIGEALGLEVESISKDFRTLHIQQSAWEGMTQEPKTASAVRDVDLSSGLAAILKDFVADRKTGFLFRNAVGKPLAQSNVLRRSLHPVRFRATHLSKSRVPESLVKFWMGHAESNQTEEYVKLSDEVVYRSDIADRIGLGFELLPEKPIVRIVRRKSVKVEVVMAV